MLRAALSNRNTVQATYVILNLLAATLKFSKKKVVKLILIVYFLWPNISKMVSFQHEINIQADLILLCFAYTACFINWSFVCFRRIYWHHFSNNICSLCVSVSRFVILAIFQTFCICYYDLWSLMLLLQEDYNSLKAQMMVGIFWQ